MPEARPETPWAMKNHTFVLLLSMVVLTSRALLAQPEPFSVRVSFGYTDPEQVRWTGSVTADQASIISLEGWLFLAPDSISFNTFEISAGGPVNKGLTITGSASSGGRISILTDHGSFSVPVFSLRLGNPVRLLDGAARAERLPDAMNLSDDSGEDDYPSIAVGKDSTAWAVWQSYGDQFDEVRFAKYEDKWRTYTVLPGVSGDVWRPQVAIDLQQRPTVVWSQQVKGNFDLYARTLDPEQKTWLKTLRLTSHPNSDIDHHLISDDAGNLWLVWQGFHGDNSDVFLRRYDGSGWSEEVRITDHQVNDWEPRIAVDSRGKAYIVWDTYRNGNYDVYMRSYQKGDLGPLVPIAATSRFEAHASIAIDGQNRIWVAWDEAGPNWGKDFGPTIDPNWRESSFSERFKHSPGLPVYDLRTINLVVLDGELRKTPVGDFHPLDAAKGDSYDYPQLLVKPSHQPGRAPVPPTWTHGADASRAGLLGDRTDLLQGRRVGPNSGHAAKLGTQFITARCGLRSRGRAVAGLANRWTTVPAQSPTCSWKCLRCAPATGQSGGSTCSGALDRSETGRG